MSFVGDHLLTQLAIVVQYAKNVPCFICLVGFNNCTTGALRAWMKRVLLLVA